MPRLAATKGQGDYMTSLILGGRVKYLAGRASSRLISNPAIPRPALPATSSDSREHLRRTPQWPPLEICSSPFRIRDLGSTNHFPVEPSSGGTGMAAVIAIIADLVTFAAMIGFIHLADMILARRRAWAVSNFQPNGQ
jgi:hypothetical protein